MRHIAFIGDLHLCERSPRFTHALDVLDWVIADLHGVQAEWGRPPLSIVCCGDLVEGAPSPREWQALLTRVRRLMTIADRVVLIQGNHEAPDALRLFHGETDPDDRLLPSVTPVWNTVETIRWPEAVLIAIPYPRLGRPPFADCVGDSIADGQRLTAETITRAIQTAVRLYRPKPVLVAGHVTVEGMTTRDAEFELHSGTEVVVPVSAFDGVALGAVGHIHRAQDVAPQVIGVGSLIRHSFAEAKDAKSYTLARIAEGAVTWARRPVPARAMIQLHETWPSDPQSVSDVAAEIERGTEIKVIVEIAEDQVGTFDPTVFDPIREVAAYFVLEKRVLAVQRTRAAQLAARTSLAEQLTAWAEATGQGLDPPRRERLRQKLDGLESA